MLFSCLTNLSLNGMDIYIRGQGILYKEPDSIHLRAKCLSCSHHTVKATIDNIQRAVDNTTLFTKAGSEPDSIHGLHTADPHQGVFLRNLVFSLIK